MASKVIDLIYWRNVGRTGVVFTGLVVGLACLFQLSLITVVSNSFLTVMAVTFPTYLLCKGLHVVRLLDGSHPFRFFLDEDPTLTDDTTIRVVEHIVLLIATFVTEIKRLVFIENMFDSFKFLLLLYLLTYVGIQTNGLTLVMTVVICAFSLPLFYRLNQARIERIVKAVNASLDRGKQILDSIHELIFPPPPPASSPTPPALKPKLKTK
ncbi:reticulon-2b [Clupea harengus]|uniref:Reticulon n=1 Tax=Clupea harengus TaxID=7950 RepID=A0A6P8FYG6_CLUHA|nr:reticulon-2b [Clupea harengus]